MESIVRVEQGLQYDGTNGSAVLALYPDSLSFTNAVTHASIKSEVGGVLTIHYDDYGQNGIPFDFTISEGQWVIPWTDGRVDIPQIVPSCVRLSGLVNP